MDGRGKHGEHARGPDHPRWNEDRKIASTGYVKVRVGRSHPLADPNGYCYEHLLVWTSAGLEPPGPDELLHHKNGRKTDNRIENLGKMIRSDHSKLTSEKIPREQGRFSN
jgi:hypothetical protein